MIFECRNPPSPQAPPRRWLGDVTVFSLETSFLATVGCFAKNQHAVVYIQKTWHVKYVASISNTWSFVFTLYIICVRPFIFYTGKYVHCPQMKLQTSCWCVWLFTQDLKRDALAWKQNSQRCHLQILVWGREVTVQKYLETVWSCDDLFHLKKHG